MSYAAASFWRYADPLARAGAGLRIDLYDNDSSAALFYWHYRFRELRIASSACASQGSGCKQKETESPARPMAKIRAPGSKMTVSDSPAGSFMPFSLPPDPTVMPLTLVAKVICDHSLAVMMSVGPPCRIRDPNVVAKIDHLPGSGWMIAEISAPSALAPA